MRYLYIFTNSIVYLVLRFSLFVRNLHVFLVAAYADESKHTPASFPPYVIFTKEVVSPQMLMVKLTNLS